MSNLRVLRSGIYVPTHKEISCFKLKYLLNQFKLDQIHSNELQMKIEEEECCVGIALVIISATGRGLKLIM